MNVVLQQSLSVVHAPSLVEHVYKHLRSRIISGSITTGTRLLELELAQQMHVSQGSAREALGRLERDGLVERKERRGTFVTALSQDDMHEVFALRACIEQFVVYRVMGFIQARHQQELEAVVVAMQASVQRRDILAIFEHDHDFHHMIVQWANHATLLRIWRPLSAQIQRFMVASVSQDGWNPPNIVAAHQELIEVLRGDDANYAALCFEQHIAHAWNEYMTT